jgi:hypothetical protein
MGKYLTKRVKTPEPLRKSSGCNELFKYRNNMPKNQQCVIFATANAQASRRYKHSV